MERKQPETKNKYRIDIIVISAILLVSLSLFAFAALTKKRGAVVVVEIDGVTVGEFSLNESRTCSLNGGSNVLVIENGAAYLNFSDCPDHTCEKTGKIKYVGQTIVCLPNRLSITVKGDADGGIDLVS